MFDVQKLVLAVNKLAAKQKHKLTDAEKATINMYLTIVGDMDVATLDPQNKRFMTVINEFYTTKK
ncbi:hypothetical protein ABEX78_19630 [Priestia megaterium]